MMKNALSITTHRHCEAKPKQPVNNLLSPSLRTVIASEARSLSGVEGQPVFTFVNFFILTSLFLSLAFLLASCEKSEQRKFAGWGKKWNISISFDQTDYTPHWELTAPMEFNKRKGTVNINDSIIANYTYNADLNQITIIDTTKISYNNVQVWALMVMDGLFNEDFTFIGGQWSYYLNMDSLNSEIQPKEFPSEYSSYNGWIAQIQE